MKIRRKTFDLVLTMSGAALFIVLIAAGSLLMWGSSFTNSNVHNQLAAQQIYFPPKSQITPAQRPYLLQYANQEVLTGPQAAAYAKKITSDIYNLPYHGVYSKLSAASMANPSNAKLAADVEVAFKGVTLRGLLLEAYAFSVLGEVAWVSSIIAFCLAGVVLILTILGLVHWNRVSEEVQFPRGRHTHEQPAEQAA